MSMSGYPYEVVQGPQSASYAGPTVNWSAPLQALAGQRQNQPGQGGQQSPQLTAQYAQLLQRLLGRGGGSPLSLSSGAGLSPGTMGGTGGGMGGLY